MLEARRILNEANLNRNPRLSDVAPTTVEGAQEQIDCAKALLLSRTGPDVVEAVEHLISMSIIGLVLTLQENGKTIA